ncbi:hypothetical protein EDB81DRAFT_808977 [Dactylonectria macrodidyma]|uniref:DUF7136 domain-containing protein n=1 Tax=Dactylonectria macrodidyma TaxID=307937 RepID=A0A9P9IQZ6_9HYPO|nr:hypothetical protein EDB81DRAFT_808977 [Dactylonectria macrodidyma]
MDVTFPRNEAYRPSEVFPISLAVQDYTELWELGNFTFIWTIMPYSSGRIRGGIIHDRGYFHLQKPREVGKPGILVANTNVSDWIVRKSYGEQYMLQWHILWNIVEDCGQEDSKVFGNLMFSIQTGGEAVHSPNGTANGKNIGVLDVPACPVLGSVVDIAGNSTAPSCPVVHDKDALAAEGTLCSVKIDKAIKTSISSLAASSTTSSLLATAVTTALEPTETDASSLNHPRLWCMLRLQLYGSSL